MLSRCVTRVLLCKASYYISSSCMQRSLWAQDFIKRFTAAQMRKDIESKASKSETSAVTTLLNAVCDVVVELDADLDFSKDHKSFTALLMLAPNRSTQGAHFQDFLPSEVDKQRFKAQVVSPLDTECMAGAGNFTMRDSLGNNLKMEILSAQFEGLDNTTHYLVGIREFDDAPLAALRSSAAGTRKKCQTSGLSVDGQIPVATKSLESVERDLVDGGSESSKLASVKSSRGGLALPTMKRTQAFAQEFSLVATMLTWNVVVPRTSCCKYHAFQVELSALAKRLRKRPCDAKFGPMSGLQCRECGIIADGLEDDCEGESMECDICDSSDFDRVQMDGGEHVMKATKIGL